MSTKSAVTPVVKPLVAKAPKAPGLETVKPSHKTVHVVDLNHPQQVVVRTFSKADHGKNWLELAIQFLMKCLNPEEKKPKNYALKGVAGPDEEVEDVPPAE